MPSYFYHLKFELYSTPPSESGVDAENRASCHGAVWLPKKSSSIFDELPSHPRNPSASPQNHPRKSQTSRSRDPRATSRVGTDSGVIDCGALRPAQVRDDRYFVLLGEAQHRRQALSVPPPQPSAALNPQTAVKDWRFRQISVESIDIDCYTADTMQESHATTAAAATVGPSMGTAGKGTKALYLPLATAKNTNMGWGIVHLYREGNATPELRLPPRQELQDEQDQDHIDCTTVCIPAVPSYLSPSDFLGFIGDRWREHISHYRMIMTGWMNRYLVLMKFRDSKQARLFGQEFDGRVFNHIEVRLLPMSLGWEK